MKSLCTRQLHCIYTCFPRKKNAYWQILLLGTLLGPEKVVQYRVNITCNSLSLTIIIQILLTGFHTFSYILLRRML